MDLSSFLGHNAATSLVSAATFTTAPSSVVYSASTDPTSTYTPCYGPPLSPYATDGSDGQMAFTDDDWDRLPDWRCRPGDGIDSFQTGWRLKYRDKLLSDVDELKLAQKKGPDEHFKYRHKMRGWAWIVHTGGATQIAEWYIHAIFDALNRADYEETFEGYLSPDLLAARCWEIVNHVDKALKNYHEPAPGPPIPSNAANGMHGLPDDSLTRAYYAAGFMAGVIGNAV